MTTLLKYIKLFSLAVLFCLILISCSYKQETIKTELYFGLSNIDGPITDEEWNSFRIYTLDKTLPGYTLINANGYWKGDNSTTYTEKTVILIYIHSDSPEENKKIESVIKKYKGQFNQESVLRTDHPIEYDFK